MKPQMQRMHQDVFLFATALFLALCGNASAQCNCDPLPAPLPNETVVYVNNTAELNNAIGNANGKTTIYMNSGTYGVSSTVFINVYNPDITIRSTTGNRNDVIVVGEGMDASGIGMGFYIDADNVTVADVTVREVQNHGFFVNPGADNCLFHNVRGVDCGEQIFKASGTAAQSPKNNGIIECSTFEYTSTLDDGDDGWYTNGIDLLNSHNWIIRDNTIRNIKHNPALTSNLAGPAILAWQGSANTTVERNRIIECDFGISFGNAGEGGVSHTGGIIRNNFVLGYSESDFGIGLIYAPNAKVINNTVYSPGGWQWGIEARFPQTSGCVIMNNYTDEAIFDNRDGASCTLATNITSAAAGNFVNAASGDLHLVSGGGPAVNAGTATPDRTHDIDCGGIVGIPDAGADEFGSIPTGMDILPAPVEASIYPVPATHRVTVSAEGLLRVQLHDLSGKLIAAYPASGASLTFELANTPKGVYFITAITHTGACKRKLLAK